MIEEKIIDWQIKIRDALQTLNRYAFLLDEWVDTYPDKPDIVKQQALHRASQIEDFIQLLQNDFENDIIYDFIQEWKQKATEKIPYDSGIDNLIK